MSGDRGLAFVVAGLIGASMLWINQRGAARSDDPGVPASTLAAPGDARFVAKAVQHNLAGSVLGDLAQQKGGQAVRLLAARLSNYYRSANSQLLRLASLEGIHIRGEIDGESRAIYDYLAGLAGDAFDREYSTYVLQAHHRAAAALQVEATSGKYPELKRFAAESLTAEKQRLLLLEDTAAQVGAADPIE